MLLPRQLVALLALVALIAGAFSAVAPAGAQDGSEFDVQVRAQLRDDGRIEFGLRADGANLTPTLRFYTPGRSGWAVSSVVESNSVQLQVIARTRSDGDVEFGIRADGETVLQGQVFPIATAANTWLISRAASVQSPDDAGDLVIYSGRGQSLVGEIIERFEEQTGINVKVRYGGTSELALTIGEEGRRSPADIFYGQDAGALGFLAESGLAAQLPADITAMVDPRYQDDEGRWIATSGRARVLIVSTERVADEDRPNSVFDLVDPEWKGRVGWAPGNGSFQAFVTAMRVIHGEATTEQWLRDMLANDVHCRRNNSTQINAVIAGAFDIGMVNHYYRFRSSYDDNRQLAVNYFPPGDAGEAGALINIAGVAMLEGTTNQANALRFVRFLLSEEGQTYFRNETNEYPVASGVEPIVELPPLATLNPPNLALTSISDLQGTLDLFEKVGVVSCPDAS